METEHLLMKIKKIKEGVIVAKAKFQMGDIVKIKNVNWMSAKYRGLVTEIITISTGQITYSDRKRGRMYTLKRIGWEREFKASDLDKATNREVFLYHLHGPGKY